MKKVKYLILGAGISGLTFANYINDDFLLVEKDSRCGGYCKTIKRNGFVWDYAGHFFHFNNEEMKNNFINKIPNEEIMYNNKCTKILYKDSLIDFPFQMNIHQLEKQEFIDCLYDLFNKEEKQNYDNFLDMLYGKFGKSIVEKFLKPYNEKLYAIDLKELDVDAMGRFFPYADKDAIINNMKEQKVSSYNSSFLYPRNGAESFIKVLVENIDENNIILNTSVNKIDIENKKVYLSNNNIINYEYLINTIPLNCFFTLIGGYEDIIKEMSYNKVLVLNLGFDTNTDEFKKEHWIYIPDKESNYYRIGFYSNILSSDKLSMYIEIGYERDFVISEEEIKKQLGITLENLKKSNIINDNMKLVDYEAIIMDPAYVHINSKTSKKIKKIMEVLNSNNIFSIGRYGAWTYNSMEDSMLAAKELCYTLKK